MSAKDAALLARAKTDVDLPGWFATLGWVADPEHDSKLHRALRGPGGERVIIARQGDGHWTFFDPSDAAHSGTIFDAASIYAGAATTGQRFAVLRRALESLPPPVPVQYAAKPTATSQTPKGPARVLALDAEGTAYLSLRGLWESTVAAFSHALRTVQGRGVMAPHNSQGGEERGQHHRHFSGGNSDQPGRGRSLWVAVPAKSQTPPTQIVVAESYIDGMSAWQMLPAADRPTAAVVSTGGSLCAGSLDKLHRTLTRVPGIRLLDATDNAEATTDRRTAELRAAAERAGASYSRFCPPPGCKDWNDAVQAAAVAQAAALMPAAIEEEDGQALSM